MGSNQNKRSKMAKPNPLRQFALKANKYPSFISRRLMTAMFRHTVKLAGTAKLDILASDLTSVTFQIKNRKKVQNHIGSVHAAAMGLLAESATGFMTGMSVPDDRIIVIRSMKLEYLKRASGDMKAVASFTDEQLAYVKDNEKGEIQVPVI